MLKDPRMWLAAVGLAAAGCLLGPQLIAAVSSGRKPVQRQIVETDYLCRETKEVFRLPASPTPPPHPRTGRTTLVRAEFDERAGKWKPAAPLDLRQRAALAR